MTKRAVVVGINDYSVQGFNNLNGCIRDADSMYYLLIDAFLFDPSQVYLYKDADASASNILRAINYILSISEPGDVACFYYAGHGGLYPVDPAGTYYQTIIPHSGRYITDWDLAQAADSLQPGNVNFTVILDSCHSGGMIEPADLTNVRTINLAADFITAITATMNSVIPFGIALPDLTPMANNVTQAVAAPPATVCYTEAANREFLESAKATVLAASRWDEYAGENADHGFLTSAMLDTVNASNFTISHKELHHTLTTKVHDAAGHEQHPVLRGQANRMDETFLQGWSNSL